ncbi:MAG: lytic transglycosylase domain-containing protein [Candidatus Competibacteraceae bacterium]
MEKRIALNASDLSQQHFWNTTPAASHILLGTAYLRLILDAYIPVWLPWEVRRDLALAAYNWGPDRISCYLIGTNPPGAVAEVRARLERAASAETRQYVRWVNERLALYGSDTLAVTGWNFSAAHSTKAVY